MDTDEHRYEFFDCVHLCSSVSICGSKAVFPLPFSRFRVFAVKKDVFDFVVVVEAAS